MIFLRPKPTPFNFRVAGVFFIIWGILALLISGGDLIVDLRFHGHAVETQAKIIGETAPGGHKNDRFILEYFVDGKSYNTTSLNGPSFYKKDEPVGISYNPENPTQARENGYLWVDLIWFFGGLISLALGTFLWRRSSKLKVG